MTLEEKVFLLVGGIENADIEKALNALGIKPDVKGDVRWIHRQDSNKDWYFVTPLKSSSFRGSVTFAATGSVELWNPVTGETEPLKAEIKNGCTVVDLDMPHAGSCFIVIDRSATHVNPADSEDSEVMAVDGAWSLTFPEGWGAPAQMETEQLKPWCELQLSDEAKAFSGTVTYTTSFSLDAPASGNIKLNLGAVSSIAEVRVNGKSAGTLWCSPYIAEIGEYVQQGENILEVDVTSTWFNRLVYDAALKESERKTWVINGPGSGNKLVPYGLMGPVSIR